MLNSIKLYYACLSSFYLNFIKPNLLSFLLTGGSYKIGRLVLEEFKQEAIFNISLTG